MSVSVFLFLAELGCSSGWAAAPATVTPPRPANLAQTAAPPVIGGCQVFPTDSVWNARVDSLPVDSQSQNYVKSIGLTALMHADFGTVYNGAPNGIPFVVVPGSQPMVNMNFSPWGAESDAGPYPIPADAPIEGGPNATGDRHVLVLDQGNCTLYELGNAQPQLDGTWDANCGAVFHLDSDALRPSTWTSADAAGLPILPGLVRYDEVASGAITHAIRFTANQTQNIFVWPARHEAGAPGSQLPPMGQRFRLKANYPINSFPQDVQVILQALKTYGMILADNGSSWYVSGAPDPRWSDNDLHRLGEVPGSAFEAVDESSLMSDPNSGRAGPPINYNHFTYLPTASN